MADQSRAHARISSPAGPVRAAASERTTALSLLAPHHGDGDKAERIWRLWLARLRRFPLRGPNATPDELNFKRVVAGREPSSRWYREDTGNALVELVAAALSSDVQALSQDAEARQAVVEIAAALAATRIPVALALQERIKQLR